MVRLHDANGIKHMKIKFSVIIPALLVGLMLHQPVMAKNAEAYGAALIDARESLAKAAEQAQLWTTSDALLAKAKAAAADGFYDQAVEYVNEAKLHGELALATALREKKVWRNGVPR